MVGGDIDIDKNMITKWVMFFHGLCKYCATMISKTVVNVIMGNESDPEVCSMLVTLLHVPLLGDARMLVTWHISWYTSTAWIGGALWPDRKAEIYRQRWGYAIQQFDRGQGK